MRIYLITHAHTEQIPQVAVDAWSLSARGLAQAQKLAQASFWGEIDRLVVSSEPKSMLTVEAIAAKRAIPVWIDARFDEMRRSGWVEDYAERVRSVFAQPDVSFGGWETARHTRERAMQGIDDLRRRFPSETLALVGHGICLSLIRSEVMDAREVDFSSWQRLSFGTYAVIEGEPLTLLHDFEMNDKGVR